MLILPSSIISRPSLHNFWANTVEVVVPSPTAVFVVSATSLINKAPWRSKASLTSIDLATVTPSLVIWGE